MKTQILKLIPQVLKLLLCGFMLGFALRHLTCSLHMDKEEAATNTVHITPKPNPNTILVTTSGINAVEWKVPQPTLFVGNHYSGNTPNIPNNDLTVTPSSNAQTAYATPLEGIAAIINVVFDKIPNLGFYEILSLLAIWFGCIGFNDAAHNILVKNNDDEQN